MTEASTDFSGLPATADVVVVGGGVNGASTAFNLAARGVPNVVVLERSSFGGGATGKSGALVRAHYTNVYESKLTYESIKIFDNWEEYVGFGDPKFDKVGFIRVVAPEDEAALRANVDAMVREVGVDTRIVSRDELREIEPLMRTDDLTVAAYEPLAGFCDPVSTLHGFLDAAISMGAKAFEQTEVIKVLTEGQKITGVLTNRGVIATDTVVLAPGAYSDRLLSPLGIELGLTPWRSQVVVFRWPKSIDQTRRHSVVIDSTQNSWLRPEGAAGTLIGVEYGDRAVTPETASELVDPGYIEHARGALSARFPAFEHAIMRGAWTGVYMHSPDSHPIIDKLGQYDGLFVMTGDSGTSFKTSPAIGICLSEWIIDGSPRLADLTPFRASRFAEGTPWVDEYTYDAGSERSIAR